MTVKIYTGLRGLIEYNLKAGFAGLLFIILGAYCVLSIVEMASRVSTRSLLEAELNKANAVAATQYTSMNSESERAKYSGIVIHCLDRLTTDLARLEFSGSSSEVAGVEDILHRKQLECDREDSASGIIEESTMSWLPRPRHWSNELLSAITVIFAGALGSMVSAFRGKALLTYYEASEGSAAEVKGAASIADIMLGLSAGFFAYLAIKGGKFLFLIEAAKASYPLNPYALAFAGVLAGLFTEKAYGLLSALVDQATARILGGEGNGIGRTGSKSDDSNKGNQTAPAE